MKQDAWWKHTVIYEAYVDKFAGSFTGFREKIDYLENLGIGCIHVLPFFPSGGVDGGYDVTDYTAVDPRLGTLEDAEAFIVKASKHGIRVIIDLVLNHTSVEHPWFKEARLSRQNPKRDYYLWSKNGKEYTQAPNAFPNIKSSNWILNPATGDFYFATFYPEQADLNWKNPAVEEEIMRIMDFWLGLGVSGFRLDAAGHLAKRKDTSCKSLPETHEILKRLRAYLETKNAHAVLLAEVHDTLPRMREYFGNGDECHLVYHFPLAEEIFRALAENNMRGVPEMTAAASSIPANCAWAVFLRNHDELSLATLKEDVRDRVLERFDPERKHRFGTGLAMRLASLLDGDHKKILAAFRLLLDCPGSPVIYYGDEIGMLNAGVSGKIPDTRAYVRGAFDWHEAVLQEKNPDALSAAIARMIRIRRSTFS
ncbi:MAG: alpha-amylase family glycosyl hydrolase [bacterium]|nr:alpha-amylase family glycosyl hydrolase [bacterium]